MKVCVIQPAYSMDPADNEKCFEGMLSLMDQCDDSLDLIVLPEYCDIPANTADAAGFHASIRALNTRAKEAARALAIRTNAMVFANFADETSAGFRNTTFAFDRKGNEAGKYYKAHPAPCEVKTPAQGGNGMDCTYSYSYQPPYVVEMEGLRFGFLTCYDFYMYENFPQLARENLDVIIGCSHQRTDPHEMLETIGRFVSLNTNAFLIRSAVSMGEDAKVCGCSMVADPSGKLILNMESKVGLGICEIDPKAKFFKPAGFKGQPKAHWQYMEEGRRPWLYRPAGPMMIPDEKTLPYPRICAHRGFNSVAPENSLPAYGAAVALGAEEIEFDIWDTKDGELVSIHDPVLDRVSDGHGNVWEYTYEELLKFDFGIKKGEKFKGLRIPRFEEILQKFAGTVNMNIHVKIWDNDRPEPYYEKIAGLLRQYNCEKHCYMMTTSDKALREFHEIAPEIARCVGFDGVKDDMLRMPNRAIALGCEKVQLFKPYFDQTSVDYAHQHGILCNVFWSDDPEEAREFRRMGIDCILTNDFLQIKNALS